MGGGAIQSFETPIMTLGFLNWFLHPDRVRRGQKRGIAPEGARGIPQVSSTKPGGVIQGFQTPFMILSFFNKFLHPGRVMGGQKLFFVPEGARGMTEVSPTKMVGQFKVLIPLLWLWVFWTNFYTLAGSGGDKSGFLHQKELRGCQRYLLPRGWGNWTFWNPYLDFGYFEKNIPLVGVKGGELGFQIIWGEAHLLGNIVCEFHWFWFIFTPNMNLKLYI